MKLIIATDKEYTLRLPTFFIKSRMFWKMALKDGDAKEYEITLKNVRKIYKALKDYVKKHGHFTLVEIEGNEARVVIVI